MLDKCEYEDSEDDEDDEDTDNIDDSNETSQLLCPPKTTSEIIITPMTLGNPSTSIYNETISTKKPDHKNIKEDV